MGRLAPFLAPADSPAREREGVDLLAVLRGARRLYDEILEQEEKKRREEDAEREQLRSDPAALREHLRKWRHRDWGIQRLGADAAKGLEITSSATRS